MTRELRKFLRQVSAKKHVFGALTVFMLLLLVSFTSMMMLISEPVKAAPGDVYLYCKKITINSAYVTGDLTNFPVWVYNTSSDFASNILASGADIAYYDSTNTTRFNHEIEVWNKTTGELGVWTNVTSVASGSDTVFYMYYGDSDTGDSQNHNPTGVWDDNYTAVWHFNETSGQHYDSTSNAHTSTTVSVTTQGSTTGVTGGCDVYDGVNDYVLFPDADDYTTMSSLTFECWGKSYEGIFGSRQLLGKRQFTNERSYTFYFSNAHLMGYVFDADIDRIGRYDSDGSETPQDTDWHYYAMTWDGGTTNADMEVYINATAVSDQDDGSGTFNGNVNDGTDDVVVGNGFWEDDPTNYPWNGSLDEIRVSNIERSLDYMRATNTSMLSPSTFLTFGTQQGGEGASSFSLKGLYTDDGDRVTFNSTASTSTWCNATGPKHETCEVNQSINASGNVTEIWVWVNGTPSIGGSNFTLYASSDNSSFGVPTHDPSGHGNGIFAEDGCNITLNDTTWNAGTMGTDPFAGVGLHGPTNTSIYLRIIVAIPAGLSAGEYKRAEDAWKVYIGCTT